MRAAAFNIRNRAVFAPLACLAALLPRAKGLDVVRYEIFKGQTFVQSDTSGPSLGANLPFVLQAVAFPILPPWVTNPVVQIPGGASNALVLTVQTNGAVYNTNFVFSAAASTQTFLDASYESGNYTLTYTGKDDGAASAVISLPADNFPPAPTLSNFLAAQSIDSSSNFTLSFSPWTSPESGDTVQLIVFDGKGNQVLATPPPYQAYPTPPLAATNTSIVISNGILSYSETYTAVLTFTRVTTNNISNFTGFPFILGGFFSQTTFRLQTQPPPTAPPPPPVSPDALGNSFFSFSVASGSGPFASSGIYQLFTLPLGTNYLVLGKAGDSFTTGGYTYTKTGTNTATLSFADARAGSVSMQISFTTTNAGAFVLSNSFGAQTGFFSLAQGYAGVTPPELFLPALTNGQFQSFLSGQAGGAYEVDASADFVTWSFLTNVLLASDTGGFFDNVASGPTFYRARLSSITFPPSSLAGWTCNETITDGASPFSTNGIDLWIASTNGSSFQIIGGPGASDGSGTYSYAVTGPNSAEVFYTDSSTEETIHKQLFFTSSSAGFFFATNAASPGFQSGNFTLSLVPDGFLGNVAFTPDTAHAASVLPALGQPAALSVTDSAGYTWTLTIPADAMIAPTAISMTPFASINNSQSTVPVFSGVQLAPEGLLFDDALTLTFSSPASLAQPPILMMADGSGKGLHFVSTFNGQSNSWSTRLLHFSSGAAGNRSGANGNYGNQVAAQLAQAYARAYAQLQNLENTTANPPPPPSILYRCPLTKSQVNQQANTYVSKLFAPEINAILNLESVGNSYIQDTGSDPNAAAENALIREVIEFVSYDKVYFLLNRYGQNALKWFAIRAAAAFANILDTQHGGTGQPQWNDQLLSALQGPVMDYYFSQLTSQHDFAMLNSLKFLQSLIDSSSDDSGGDGAFFQRLASAFTFKANVALNDQGQYFSLHASGAIVLSGDTVVTSLDPSEPYLIIGSNVVNYTSGSSGQPPNASHLQLPLSYPQQIVMTIDQCSGTGASIYITSFGSQNEMWSQPPPGPPFISENYLSLDSGNALQSYDAVNVNPNYGGDYLIPIPIDDPNQIGFGIEVSGRGVFAVSDTPDFKLDIFHTPQ